MLLFALSPTAHADLPADTGRARIHLVNPGPPVSGLPVLVELTPERVAPVALAAPETLFFLDADERPLPWDLDEAAPDRVVAWVLLDEVPSGETVFEVGYGGVGSTPEPTTVWADWAGVWHLHDTQESSADLTTVPQADPPLELDGRIGSGRSFGGDAWLQVDPAREGDFDFQDGFSGSLWFRTRELVPWGALVAKGDGAWRVHQRDDDDVVALTLGPRGVGGPDHDLPLQTSTLTQNWHLLQLSVQPVDAGMQSTLWLDGTQESSAVLEGLPSTDEPVAIGFNDRFDDRTWDGWIDELRLSPTPRSDAWMRADHLNQTDGWLWFCDPTLLQDHDEDGVPCTLDPDDRDPAVRIDDTVVDPPESTRLGLACTVARPSLRSLLRR